MPRPKKTRATTGQVARPIRANQATASNDFGKKDEDGQGISISVKGRGTKRPASDDVSVLEAEDAGDSKPRARRGRPRVNKAQETAEPEDEDELSRMSPKLDMSRPPRRENLTLAEEIPETQQWGMHVPSNHLFAELGTPEATAPRGVMTEKATYQSTQEYKALEARYRELQEIGVKEAERTFDRLRKQSEERANTDKQLIATLKAQLAGETEKAKQAEELKIQLKDGQDKAEKLQGRLDEAHGSLAEARAEIKTLSTKLSAARSAESTNVKVPGSAMKSTHANNRHVASAVEAAAQIAQKKENLYGDLTGLLVCGVKRENDEEVFDCVQTGRNGTLHFKLSIGTDESPDKFEDAQFRYMPQLDAARDEALIDTLPDYLVEDITFPRLHAAKFYSRVVKALSEH
ncbi:chromosome segregation protein Csm1/Pcs1-domain-containing protein [Xylaria palmicola]|nr:chromosome segregation protein Csm1/Pcs1-domain-containing protein [Xylaria palmicola]